MHLILTKESDIICSLTLKPEIVNIILSKMVAQQNGGLESECPLCVFVAAEVKKKTRKRENHFLGFDTSLHFVPRLLVRFVRSKPAS